jgi:RHS repeat-associated protein
MSKQSSVLAAAGWFFDTAVAVKERTKSSRRKDRRRSLARHVLLGLLWVLLVSAAGSSNSYAEHWVTGLPPLGGNNGETCGSGVACAMDQQFAFYGAPPYGELGCSYGYNIWGTMTTVTCNGKYGLPNLVYSGYASLVCDGSEIQTADGCGANPTDKTPNPDQPPNGCSYAADPVATPTGMKREAVTDFSTADGLLAFKRTYYSDPNYWGDSSPYLSRLGRGWTSNFDARLTTIPTNNNPPWNTPWWVYVRLPDGSEIAFKNTSGTTFVPYAYNPVGNSWSTVSNIPETLTWNGTNWLLTLPDDSVYTFDGEAGTRNTAGSLLSIQYRGGYTQTLTWNGNGQNTQVSDSLGRSLTFTYGSNGFLSQLTDPDGHIFSYTYQDNSNIDTYAAGHGMTVTNLPDPEYGLIGVSYPDSTSVQYLYENTSFPYALTGIIDGRGIRIETTAYDTSGRVTSTQQAGGVGSYAFAYNPSAGQTTVTNPAGKTTVYSYNANVAGTSPLTQIAGQASANCAAANTTFAYDSNGYVTQFTDGEGRITQMVNDPRGIPTSITRGSGTASASTTTYTLDPVFHVPDQVVAPNLTTAFSWNSSGQLTQLTKTDTTPSTSGQTRTWNYTYTSPGGLLASVSGPLSSSGDTVSYTYNSSGFIQTVTDQVGNVTTYTAWNGRGQPTSMTDPNGVVTSLSYDALGRLLTITADASGIGAQTVFAYDAAGDITKITRPNGAYLQYTWDDAQRVTSVTDNLGNSIQYTRDNFGDVTAKSIEDPNNTLDLSQTATYDELARLLTFVGSASQTWTDAYDRTDNRTSVTDPRSNVYQWAFDSLNRLISETNEDSSTVNLTRDGQDRITAYSDPRSLTTSYTRDGFGDVIQRISPDTGTTLYSYNALGKPTQITDGRGVVTNLTYDNAGRLLTKQYPADPSENIAYTWDSTAGGNYGIGRITQITDGSGSINWTYDTLGRIVQEQKTTAGIVYTIGYGYDAAGNVTQIAYPSGRIVSYSRDALGRITGVTTQQNSRSSPVTLATSITYQPFGPLQSLWYGNGMDIWKTFTQDYLIDCLYISDTSTSPTTDYVSRCYGRTDGLNITNIWDNLNSSKSQSFWYTPSNRLQNASGIWGSSTYYYDSVGNRTYDIETAGGGTTSIYGYPYNNNQVQNITQGSTTVRSFSYDGAGNLVTDSNGSTTYNYGYNNRGRLATLTVGSTQTSSYSYDGLERLAIDASPYVPLSGITQYVYDQAGHLLAESDDAGNTLTEYVWLDDMPIALVANVSTSPTLYFVHTDHLNRPIMMTDANKAIVWQADYNPFGAVNSITGSATNNLRFPGQYFLIEDGLHYNWYRHYDPTIGRYIQPDPMGFVDGPTLYAYAKSDPLTKVDPQGRQIVIPIPGPGRTPLPPTVPGFSAWQKNAQAGMEGLLNFCKRLIGGGSNYCPPCSPYPAGTVGYIGPHAADHYSKALGRNLNPHLNLFSVNQDPGTCSCNWNKNNPDSAEPPPLPGWVDLNGGFPALSP